MPRLVCQQAFDAGQQRRQAHVLHRGVYKLEETRCRYMSMISDIDEIARIKRKQVIHPILEHCTTFDMAQWLKKHPENVAFDTGYYLLPSVKALVGDCVPVSVLATMASDFEVAAHALVQRCEIVRIAISKRIDLEYSHMRDGQSLTRPLLCKMESLCSYALATAERYHPHRRHADP